MIVTFGNNETEIVWNGVFSRKFPRHIQEVGRRKLRMINNAADLMDLRIPPANSLEKLTGDRIGFYSIRINDQWRIIFRWSDGNATEVEIIDYH